MTVTISVRDYQKIIQNDMAISILKNLLKDNEFVSIKDVKRVLDAVEEDHVVTEGVTND